VQEIGEHGLVAPDWHSGKRSEALLEATAFGTRTIIETFEAAVKGFVLLAAVAYDIWTKRRARTAA